MSAYLKEHKINIVNLGDAPQEAIDTSHNRLFFVMAIFIAVFLLLSLRIFDVAAIRSGEASALLSSGGDGVTAVVKKRADIIDRNGVLLAVNLSTASLYADPKQVLDIDDAVKKLKAVFPNLDYNALKSKIQSEKNFVWVKRNLTPQEQYKANALGIPGFFFKDEEKRIYPHKELMAHLVGFTNIDGNGVSGVEKQFDNYFKERDENGNQNPPLQLSVDVRVQSAVHDALVKAVDEFKALGASAVVMDVDTGELISMVSLPDFNLNDPGGASDEAKFNRTSYGVYEMGSTFKTFNMALGFELGDLGMDDVFDVSKPIKVARFTINDYHQKKTILNTSEVFMQSSNIASAQIALDIGPEDQRKFMERLGLLKEVDVQLPERGRPLFPSQWSRVSAMTISYGHGIAVTSLHVVRATAALVNGGTLLPISVLKTDANKKEDGVRVISKNNSDRIRKLMRLVVKYGTGGNAEVAGYLVGGKTGTADKAGGGKYNVKANIASFVGAFPMNKPKYAIMVMVDDPVGNAKTGGYTTGGMIAAPVVHDIVSRIAPILGVMPVDENDYEIRKEFWYDNEQNNQKVALAGTR